jgi:hypothetical protein
MESLITTRLTEYGPLGVFVLLQLTAIVFLWRQNAALYRDNMELHNKRTADADKYATKYAELVVAVKQAVDAMSGAVDRISRNIGRGDH